MLRVFMLAKQWYGSPITMYYRRNGTEIHGSTKVMRYRVDCIPAVVDTSTTSTGVLWEWGLPLPEWYIIFRAACTEIMRHIGVEQSTVIIWSIIHFLCQLLVLLYFTAYIITYTISEARFLIIWRTFKLWAIIDSTADLMRMGWISWRCGEGGLQPMRMGWRWG